MSANSRKFRAIAAGGAVLGLGAVVTLAAWSDSEFAQGEFNSGSFGIQAATEGGEFADQAGADQALSLQFGADAMSPNDIVTTNYQIKNIAGGADSTVTFGSETKSDELASALTTEFVQTTDPTCNAETTGTALAEGQSFNLTGETPQNLCVKVTLGDISETTAQTANIVWEFTAEETV